MDLEYLRHDKPLHPTRVQTHLKSVPKYLLPHIAPVAGAEEAGGGAAKDRGVGFVPFKKMSGRRRGSRGQGGRGGGSRGGSRGGGKKKSDPLKKFGR